MNNLSRLQEINRKINELYESNNKETMQYGETLFKLEMNRIKLLKEHKSLSKDEFVINKDKKLNKIKVEIERLNQAIREICFNHNEILRKYQKRTSEVELSCPHTIKAKKRHCCYYCGSVNI